MQHSRKMASFSVFVLFLFISLAGISATQNMLDIALSQRHEAWMAEHGRTYKDPAEQAYRFMIFKQNIKYIEDFNSAGNSTYTLRVNEFADLTAEEFADKYMGAKIPETEQSQEESVLRSIKYELPEPADPPASVDWRAEGYVTPVKNQGRCGSCWAFAVVSAVETLFAIKNRRLIPLSEQQLVDCSKKDYGCKGGWPTKAYEYIRTNGGITSEANYPYVARDQTCNTAKASNTYVSINGYKSVPKNEQSLMAAVAGQAVSVVIRPPNNWRFYGDGIFDGPCGGGQGHKHSLHAVTVVGYGANSNGSYWIVKNSWGTRWGDSGYIKMKRDVSSAGGLCGIAEHGAYPTM